jgi:hypothetical protein
MQKKSPMMMDRSSAGKRSYMESITRYQSGIGQMGMRVTSSVMIKNKLLLVALILASILIPAAVRADRLEIQIGDRPFYSHGARYWAGDYEMIWVPGHMSRHGHWIHGQYVRGQQRRHNGQDRYDDRQNEHRDNDRR